MYYFLMMLYKVFIIVTDETNREIKKWLLNLTLSGF